MPERKSPMTAKKTPKTSTELMRKLRAKAAKKGYRSVTVLLSPHACETLESLRKGRTNAAVIEEALATLRALELAASMKK